MAIAATFAACGSSEDSTDSSTASTTAFTGEYVVNADYVKEHSDDIILVDARGEEAAKEETIKGATALDWQTIAKCSDRKAGDEGFGNVMDADELASVLGEQGIDKDKEIVMFALAQDGWGEDGRIAWELIAAGYKDVKIVNGGTVLDPVDVTIDEIDTMHMINTEELAENYDEYKVVDTRADTEYNGATDYGEAKGGHLPGAIQVRYTDLFNDDSTLKSNEEITTMLEDAGLEKDDNIVTYCTVGIRSGYMQLIMQMCGYDNVQNYDESYYRWCVTQTVEE